MNTYQLAEKDFENKLKQLSNQYRSEKAVNDELRKIYCQKAVEIYKGVNASELGMNFSLIREVFLFDEQMQRSLIIEENKMVANEVKEFLKEYSGNSSEIINIKVTLAHTMIESNNKSQWDNELYEIWHQTMKDIPGFTDALMKEKSYWDNWREKNFKIENSNANTDPAMIFSVYMPVVVKKEESSGIQKVVNNLDVLPGSVFNSIIEDFNSFQLHKYINDFSVKSINLGLEGDNWVFSIKTNEFVSDEKRDSFLDTFKLQISEGWGEAMGGKKVKHENSCFFVSFDHENAQIMEEVKKKNKIK